MTPSNSDANDRSQAFEIEVNGSLRQADGCGNARRRAAARPYTPDYERPPARRPASEREGSFSALGWLLDGATGLIGEIRHNDLGLSEEFWVHAYAARREGILAVQAALNSILSSAASSEKFGSERLAQQQRRGSIEIDF